MGHGVSNLIRGGAEGGEFLRIVTERQRRAARGRNQFERTADLSCAYRVLGDELVAEVVFTDAQAAFARQTVGQGREGLMMAGDAFALFAHEAAFQESG